MSTSGFPPSWDAQEVPTYVRRLPYGAAYLALMWEYLSRVASGELRWR
jgi:hypothetical protein